MIDPILNPIPEELRSEYDELIRDPWLAKKVDRLARVAEKDRYISTYLPELKWGNKLILDVGTGTGEFLEYCREYCNDAIGIEIWHDLKCRWTDYIRFSKIQWIRQGLTVKNYDFSELIFKEVSEFDGKKYHIINLQHSINFIFRKVFDFKDSRPLYFNDGSWILGADFNVLFSRFFWWCSEHLEKNGILLVASLRSENRAEYSEKIIKIAGEFGLGIIKDDKNLVHKWRKL